VKKLHLARTPLSADQPDGDLVTTRCGLRVPSADIVVEGASNCIRCQTRSKLDDVVRLDTDASLAESGKSVELPSDVESLFRKIDLDDL